jgi:hypothetical protein
MAMLDLEMLMGDCLLRGAITFIQGARPDKEPQLLY